ncbi:MAG: hypothetical protein AAGD34_05370 [Pseudomonadota bacterium]
MRALGAILSVVGGIAAVAATLITLSFAPVDVNATAAELDAAIALVWMSVICAVMCMIFGMLALGSNAVLAGFFVIFFAVAGSFAGGIFVGAASTMAALGGVLAVIGGFLHERGTLADAASRKPTNKVPQPRLQLIHTPAGATVTLRPRRLLPQSAV